MDVPWEIVTPLFTSIIGWLGRHLVSVNKWAKVRKIAKEIAKDPGKTNDAREAISQALLQVQLDKISKEAQKVLDSFVINGSNPIPKIDIPIEIVKEEDKKNQ